MRSNARVSWLTVLLAVVLSGLIAACGKPADNNDGLAGDAEGGNPAAVQEVTDPKNFCGAVTLDEVSSIMGVPGVDKVRQGAGYVPDSVGCSYSVSGKGVTYFLLNILVVRAEHGGKCDIINLPPVSGFGDRACGGLGTLSIQSGPWQITGEAFYDYKLGVRPQVAQARIEQLMRLFMQRFKPAS